jgi:hypothetical protein
MHRVAWIGALAIAAAGFAPAATAQSVYTWVDEDGSVHYVDDPALVPDSKKPKARTTTGADIGTVPSANTAPPPEPSAKADPTKDEKEPAKEKPAARSDTPPSTEETWRARFKDVRQRIKRLTAQIDLDEKSLETAQADSPTGSECAECARLKIQIRDATLTLDETKKELDELDHQASREAVPRDWRR